MSKRPSSGVTRDNAKLLRPKPEDRDKAPYHSVFPSEQRQNEKQAREHNRDMERLERMHQKGQKQ